MRKVQKTLIIGLLVLFIFTGCTIITDSFKNKLVTKGAMT